MGRPEQNSREKAYTLHQNQEVEIHGPSSESNLNFKSLILAQVSRIVIYGYFKFWQKRNTVSFAQLLLKIISQKFYQLPLLLMPIYSVIYKWIIKTSFYIALQICVKREHIQ